MEDSYILSSKLKDYCIKHEIERKLSKAIDEILTSLPPDPYSTLCQVLKEVIIINIK